jgi:hypothetical protein
MEVISEHHEFLDKQKTNGRKGGRSKTQADPNANPSLTLPTPNTQYPIPNKKEIDFSELPDVLNTAEFRSAWEKFVQYRQQKRKPIYQASFTAKWKQMQTWGIENSIKSIEQTIANGWQGIFPQVYQDSAKNNKSEENSKYKDAF